MIGVRNAVFLVVVVLLVWALLAESRKSK